MYLYSDNGVLSGPIVPDDSLRLKFYGYYKQATIGKCNTTQPWMVQVVERTKWGVYAPVSSCHVSC